MDRAARVSVVIPTYNRADLLRRTLDSLAEQNFAATDSEVVVSDDGSSDHTAEVVRSYRGLLRMRYHFQEDLGFRAAAARNAGARLATAPVLAFLDTGVLPNTNFLRETLYEHRARRAVMGYVHGFHGFTPAPTLDDPRVQLPVHAIHHQLAGDRRFRDSRHYVFSMADFDLSRLVVPWWICWTSNFSVRAQDFWLAGGFDEDFRSWGSEDVELAYRLHRHGVPFTLSRAAWSVELPHHRETAANHESSVHNTELMFRKHPEPMMELCSFLTSYAHDIEAETVCGALLDWRRRSAGRQVTAELAAAVGTPPGRVAVFGSGGAVPASWATDGCAYTLLDFDGDLLAGLRGPFTTRQAIGLRSGLPDSDADVVVLTSRLAGLWPQWNGPLLAEAHRVGREVRLTRELRAATG